MLHAKALPVGLGRDQPLELGHELVVPAQCELGIVEKLESPQAALLELRGFRLVDGLSREVGERGADPERKRPPEILGRLSRSSRLESGPGRLDESIEPGKVELRRIELEPVARSVPLDAIGPEHTPQPVHVDLERRDRGARRICSPEGVNEPVARNDRIRVQQQEGQQRPLLRRPERQGAVVPDRFDRSQDPEFDARRPL
jgi:hypothetical protein